MRVDYLSRFDRAYRILPPKIKEEIQKTIQSFLDQLTQGFRSQGLGLRRLKGSLWEIRVGLQHRVLFELKKDWITFLFVGNHDEVKRFLKSF